MAFNLQQDAVFVVLEFEDADGDKTHRRIQMVWDTDLATTLANAATLASHFQGVTDAAINRFTVNLSYENDTPATRSGENQEVAHVVIGMNQNPPAGLSKTKVLEIPAPHVNIRVAPNGAGSNLVDLNATELTTLITDFSTGGIAYLSHGQTAKEVKDGYVHHMRSKRG